MRFNVSRCAYPPHIIPFNIQRTLKAENLVRFFYKRVQIIHPCNGTGAGSLQTVGFHADTSDIEITLKLVYLLHYIELFRT